MPLINCEVNVILTWSSTCVITNSTGAGTFAITDTKLYVPVVILLTQDNSKLLQQLKPGFKRIVNWNKYLSTPELLAQNPNLNHLVEPSSQGVNRHFVLAFENDTQRSSHSGYYLLNVEIKYEYLTGEEILPSNQERMIEQAKLTYCPLGKAFEKQTKTIENQGKNRLML